MRLITLAAALSLIATLAFAGEQGEPGDCTGSTPEMVDCLNAQRAHWDKELTIAYQALMKSAGPVQHDKLREAERAWIKYRDANCGYYAAGEGTIARVNAAACSARHDQATCSGIVESAARDPIIPAKRTATSPHFGVLTSPHSQRATAAGVAPLLAARRLACRISATGMAPISGSSAAMNF